MLRYAKAITALIGAGVAALVPALADGSISGVEWIGIVMAVVTGGGVASVRNRAPAAQVPATRGPSGLS